jgi:hypothetical protein
MMSNSGSSSPVKKTFSQIDARVNLRKTRTKPAPGLEDKGFLVIRKKVRK